MTEPAEILFISGDICPTYSHGITFQEEWLRTDFVSWVNSLPFKQVIFIAGNHDFWFQRNGDDEIKIYEYFHKPTNGKLIYLQDTEFHYDYMPPEKAGAIIPYKIYGTPWCKMFGNWAFMKELDDLPEVYGKIPYNCDILLTHDAPQYKGLGEINEGMWKGVDAGNPVLFEAIKEKKPKYSFNGHIHTGNHTPVKTDDTTFMNASVLNERYKIAYNPTYIEL